MLKDGVMILKDYIKSETNEIFVEACRLLNISLYLVEYEGKMEIVSSLYEFEQYVTDFTVLAMAKWYYNVNEIVKYGVWVIRDKREGKEFRQEKIFTKKNGKIIK
jgi:hypothetical protein